MKSTKNKEGNYVQPPPAVRHLFTCPTCGAYLEYLPGRELWVCPRGLHSRAVPNGEIRSKCEKLMNAIAGRKVVDLQQRVSQAKWHDEAESLEDRRRRINETLEPRRETCCECGHKVTEWREPEWSHGRICVACYDELSELCVKCGAKLTIEQQGWHDHLCSECWGK